MQLAYNVRNVHRAVGTRLSAHITRRYGMDQLPPGQITVRLRGSAGQSLGAFAVQGLRLEVFGDANDYVGKGLSGGTIVVRPLVSSPMVTNENVIIGNTCLYGATAGKLFAAGRAGERFAVRNSGAITVVEGCGDNGCEYMTGGVVRGARADRRQLRRRHERRHGLRLRSRRALRRAHQPGHGDLPADRGRALRGRAAARCWRCTSRAPRAASPSASSPSSTASSAISGRSCRRRCSTSSRSPATPRDRGRAHGLRSASGPADERNGVRQRRHPVRELVGRPPRAGGRCRLLLGGRASARCPVSSATAAGACSVAGGVDRALGLLLGRLAAGRESSSAALSPAAAVERCLARATHRMTSCSTRRARRRPRRAGRVLACVALETPPHARPQKNGRRTRTMGRCAGRSAQVMPGLAPRGQIACGSSPLPIRPDTRDASACTRTSDTTLRGWQFDERLIDRLNLGHAGPSEP